MRKILILHETPIFLNKYRIKNKVILLIFFAYTLTINSVSGQTDCVHFLRIAQEKCHSTFPQCSAKEIITKADEFLINPPNYRCQNSVGYLLKLSEFYLMAVSTPNCSSELALEAIDKAIELVKITGDIKPNTIKKGGEGASRLRALYDMKCNLF